jgi:predicted DNA-binding transcriptional regulator YafY
VTNLENTFTSEELEALILGACWAMEDEDDSIADAATTACEKLASMLPNPKSGVLACPIPNPDDPTGSYWIPFLNGAAEAERKLELVYRDKMGSGTSRVIWRSWRGARRVRTSGSFA